MKAFQCDITKDVTSNIEDKNFRALTQSLQSVQRKRVRIRNYVIMKLSQQKYDTFAKTLYNRTEKFLFVTVSVCNEGINTKSLKGMLSFIP